MFARAFQCIGLWLLCVSTPSLAADISGRVTTAEGQPVCALVLASGRSMFSCNPIGEFSLVGLPTEPDGSVNLQVYAEGFYPYLRNITQFGPQPAVIMPRAGSCPVDDGLSDTSPLDGTYTLVRGSVIYNDATGFDTADPASNIQVAGTWVINGSSSSQRLDFTVNGILQPPIFVNSTMLDYGYALVEQESSLPIGVIERGDKLTTLVNGNILGQPFVEVDQWVKVTSEVAALASDIPLSYFTLSTAPTGGLLGTMAEGQSLKVVPFK